MLVTVIQGEQYNTGIMLYRVRGIIQGTVIGGAWYNIG